MQQVKITIQRRRIRVVRALQPAKLLTRLLSPYVVHVYYANYTRVAKHYAKSWADALEWCACYGTSDHCAVYENFLGMSAHTPVAVRA